MQNARGLDGELRVRLRLPDDRVFSGQRVTLEREDGSTSEHAVRTARFHEATLAFVRLEGVEDRIAGEACQGAELWVQRSWFSTAPQPVEFLIGARAVERGTGDALGHVEGLMHNGAQFVLVLETPGGERLVPYVDALVDVSGGVVHVEPLPGLI